MLAGVEKDRERRGWLRSGAYPPESGAERDCARARDRPQLHAESLMERFEPEISRMPMESHRHVMQLLHRKKVNSLARDEGDASCI